MFDDSNDDDNKNNDDFLFGFICGICAADRDGSERFSFRDLLIYGGAAAVVAGIVTLYMFALTR